MKSTFVGIHLKKFILKEGLFKKSINYNIKKKKKKFII